MQPMPWEMPGSIDFDTIPDLKPKLFGGYRQDGTQEIDEVFFRSVHMGGDGVEEEMLDAMKKVKEEWLAAVIVDNIHYKPHFGEIGDQPSQLGKLDDILKGPPNKLGLKMMYRAKLPSGKRIPFKAPPASMMAQSFFEDPKDFTDGMRPDDPAHYFGTNALGEKVNFITKIHKDMMKPPMQRLLFSRKVDQLTEKEKSSNLFKGSGTVPYKAQNPSANIHPSMERTNSNARTGPPGFQSVFSEERKDGPKYIPPKLPKL